MTVSKKKNPVSPEGEILKPHSQWGDVWRRLRRNRLAMIGMGIVLLLIVMAVFAPLIAPYDYEQADYAARLVYPCRAHLLGTDQFGRDLLSRIIYGGRISLLVSMMGVAISLVVGSILGAIAGYYGGKLETVIMRIADVLMSIPATLLAVCISASLGTGVWQTAIAVSVTGEETIAEIADDEPFSITLIGLCTDICVISNAMLLKARLPEVPIYVNADCCAGVTPESHENALSAMKMCQIEVRKSA